MTYPKGTAALALEIAKAEIGTIEEGDNLTKYGIEPSALGIKFEEETTEAATEVKFAVEGTLADGTKIYSTADEWVVGVDIFTLDADGNPVPVPAGEYLLEDGGVNVSSQYAVAKQALADRIAVEANRRPDEFSFYSI